MEGQGKVNKNSREGVGGKESSVKGRVKRNTQGQVFRGEGEGGKVK